MDQVEYEEEEIKFKSIGVPFQIQIQLNCF